MRQVFGYFLGIVLVFTVWTGISFGLARVSGRTVLHYPWEVAVAAGEHIGTLLSAFGISALRFLVALVVSFFLGLPVGLAVGFEPKLDQYLSPLIYLVYPMPPVALLLFLYMAFGLGEVVRLVVVVIALFFQMVVAAQGAAKFITPTHILSVRSAGASHWQIYWHVVIPATLPSVLTAARVSVGLGIAMLYIAETALGVVLPSSQSLGQFIKEYQLFRSDLALAGVVALALLGLFFYAILDILEHQLCRWKYVGGKGGG